MIIFLFFIKKSRMSEVSNNQPKKPYITPKTPTVEFKIEIWHTLSWRGDGTQPGGSNVNRTDSETKEAYDRFWRRQ